MHRVGRRVCSLFFIIKSDLSLTFLQILYSRYRGYRKPNGLGEQGKGKKRIGE